MNPSVAAFQNILLNFWAPRDTEEWPFEEWLRYCRSAPEQAQQSLDRLRAVLASPPPNLDEIVAHNAHLSVPLPPGAGPAATQAAYQQWLARTYARLSELLEGYLDSPEYALNHFLSTFWLHQDEQGAFAKFKAASADDPAGAQRLLAGLQRVAAAPPDNLPQLLKQWAWLSLYGDNGEEYSPQQYAEWFSAMVARLAEGLGTGD